MSYVNYLYRIRPVRRMSFELFEGELLHPDTREIVHTATGWGEETLLVALRIKAQDLNSVRITRKPEIPMWKQKLLASRTEQVTVGIRNPHLEVE
jgi:hypothetical protein